MSNVYLHLDPTQPQLEVDESNTSQGQDDIDFYNEDTFGAGAVEENWEIDHNQLVKLDLDLGKPLYSTGGKADLLSESLKSPPQLNDEELELSNRQLAQAVEELVINSDLDQDAIDPAIVSLRKQSLPSPGVIPGSPQVPGFSGLGLSGNQTFPNSSSPSIFDPPAPLFDSDKMHNIWNEHQSTDPLQKFFPRNLNQVQQSPQLAKISLQDEAILNAIKEASPELFAAQPKQPVVLKAEDLEREMHADAETNRPLSPLFGVEIPKSNNNNSVEGTDRSLPARSISPVFGSPKPAYLPIGTPPKHLIMDMMHQLEQTSRESHQSQMKGASGSIQHPSIPPGLPPPNLPFFMRGPPPPGVGLPVRMPPHGPMRMMHPGAPFLPHDIMHRLGMRPAVPVINSPIGSPRHFVNPSPHMLANPRPGFHPNMPFPPNLVRPGMQRPLIGFNSRSQNRMRHPTPTRMGPGHLHPEHSKYVLMREQRRGRNDRRNYSHSHQRMQNRDGVIGVPGDPYANIMNQREKDWVIKIQMMALQSDRPEIDDYYYQNFIERQLQEGKLNLDQTGKPTQRLITPTKPNLENRKYVPVQFTNSLGKLTASSVYSPRQIIDIAPTPDEETGDSPDSRQTLSKRLVVYKTIEKAFILLISLEEIGFQLATAPHETDEERELLGLEMKSKTGSLEEVLGFHDITRFNVHDDPIFQVMKVRKGKKLITRAIPFLDQDHVIIVVQSIFSHLAILIKRDARDGVLHEMYGPISRVLSALVFDDLVSLCTLLNSFALSAAVKDQVGISIICKVLCCGETILDSSSAKPKTHNMWLKFIQDVSDAILSVTNPKSSRQNRSTVPSLLLEDFPFDVFEILARGVPATVSTEKLRTSFRQLVATKSDDLVDGVSQIA